jgi:hypothetical protein
MTKKEHAARLRSVNTLLRKDAAKVKQRKQRPIKRLMALYGISEHFARLLSDAKNNPQIAAILRRARENQRGRRTVGRDIARGTRPDDSGTPKSGRKRMSIPVLGIPFLNRPDLLRRCVESIDYPLDHLVVIDNSNGAVSMPFVPPKLVRRFSILTHPNAGVAGSWNEIIKLFPAPWHMIVNSDVQFTRGDLERMADAADANCSGVAGCLYGNHGASWFVITEHGVRDVGLFDENFYPAYLEDCDWSRRADLLGVRRVNVPNCHAIHGDDKLTGSCTINSDPRIQQENVRTHTNNFTYYKRKWGGVNGEEKFITPFNHKYWPIQHWQFDPAFRKEQQWE